MNTIPSKLIEGFRRFRERHFERNDSLYQQLVAKGQTPKTLVVACCDSRVDPALVLDCEPGDLFVIRNVANLVPPVESRAGHHGTTAAIEYGVRTLGVGHIIVFGHAHCGGINALVKNGGVSNPDSFIDDWMCLVESARSGVMAEMPNATLEEQTRACEQRAILVSLHNLMTFSWVRERVEAGQLILHGWYFDIEHGQLLRYDAATRGFIAL
ncbi:carbonic anhydrase [Sideroxydans lithotrophicus]|uniref:Carbonic anhydrase n=1 Tax=Sideroxydans lithotrophicus (strain ES-1) TaxID=580332 RepID=D5CTG4_SIDLE|nr:carbonic anhydrase [Sideroxydans lithotrophicus]ADE10270.1 Carbonate dehydratase [Sideroxydans lithotrophicus ES-1]